MLHVSERGHLSQRCEKCYEMHELKIFLKKNANCKLIKLRYQWKVEVKLVSGVHLLKEVVLPASVFPGSVFPTHLYFRAPNILVIKIIICS